MSPRAATLSSARSAGKAAGIVEAVPGHTSNGIGVLDGGLTLFRRRLLSWYRRAKRDLDWRRTRDPYGIWLSEIMLQQTRVAAVVPYYRRFRTRFPTLRRLARARVDSVLRYWAGLGYYSRARNLHRAAKQIVTKHGGVFPREHADALALPGIGAYTAAAVLSIAYNAPLAVLDGNVARVLTRLGAMHGDPRQPENWQGLTREANRLLATGSPGDWNQAMMELGATVCTPRTPRCEECPVARWCRARALGIAGRLPTPRRKAATVRMTIAAAVLLDPSGRTLLVRHKDGQGVLFSRLWQFPSISIEASSDSSATPRAKLGASPAGPNVIAGADSAPAQEALAEHLRRTLGISPERLTPLATARHAVTFRDIRLAPYLAHVGRLPPVEHARTPLLDEIDRLPVSSATRKIAAAVLRELYPRSN